MLITDLIPKGKRRTVIWLDGTPAGILDNRDVSAYRLEAGSEIDEPAWQRIVQETILPRGKRKALELLQLQDRTTKELHDKLIDAEYTEEQTWEIIAYVASFRYIDERRYAINYFRVHAKTKSYREMQQVLLSRGVEEDTVAAAYEQFVRDSGGTDAEGDDVESPEVLAVRRYVSGRVRGTAMTVEQRGKIYSGLMRKGFSYDAIRNVLSEYADGGAG